MKTLTYEEKIQRGILKDVKLLRIPQRNSRPIPIYTTCGRCKKNKVTDHHYLCNSCWRKKQLKENGEYINK